MATMLEKKYRRYAKDVLASLIDDPTGFGCAAGQYVPYVRHEMSFPEEDKPAEPHGKYTDLVKGRISVEEFYKGNEIHDMAHAIEHALEYALQHPTHKMTVEAMVHKAHEGMGHVADFFIYSEDHTGVKALREFLQENRQRIMGRLNELSEDKGGLPPM